MLLPFYKLVEVRSAGWRVSRSEVVQRDLRRRCIEADHICELNWPGSVFLAHAAASSCRSVTEELAQ
jgi:hypothetical protein